MQKGNREMQPHLWTMTETLAALESRQISCVELATYYLERINRYNHSLKAFITVAEDVVERAREIDNRRLQGKPVGPLAGILIGVKDLFDTAGLKTTYGGRHYADHVPDQTATAVRRLEQAGAIVIGKTNLHEYAYGTTTENPHYGNCCNPWNRAKIAGGSSGGSAVAIAAGLCNASLGTDTGGSIRIPAALCGLVGFKPSYGLVSKAGVFPLAPTLDHVGPMTRSVADAQLLMDVMAGRDPADPATARIPVRSYQGQRPVAGLTVGVPKNFFFDRCHSSVLQGVHAACTKLQEQGIRLREIEIPLMSDVPDMQGVVIASEALAVHKRMLESQPDLYGADVRRRLEAAGDIKGSEYFSTLEFRRAFRQQLANVFAEVDAIVTPTTALTATDLGQWKTHIKAHEVNIRAHLTRCTNPWNLSGLPAISLPCGFSSDGLPIGLQLIGPMFADAKLLAIARAIERILGPSALAAEYR
jgi:aspartyl-tRNA(Asn)/glutamyl-tRNA(Gln) amidotransferase subunit A